MDDELHARCRRLLAESGAIAVCLFRWDGEEVARAGAETLDLATLLAFFDGTEAGGLIQLRRSRELAVRLTESMATTAHLTLVTADVVLCVSFDGRSSLRQVRLRAKQAVRELRRLLPLGA